MTQGFSIDQFYVRPEVWVPGDGSGNLISVPYPSAPETKLLMAYTSDGGAQGALQTWIDQYIASFSQLKMPELRFIRELQRTSPLKLPARELMGMLVELGSEGVSILAVDNHTLPLTELGLKILGHPTGSRNVASHALVAYLMRGTNDMAPETVQQEIRRLESSER